MMGLDSVSQWVIDLPITFSRPSRRPIVCYHLPRSSFNCHQKIITFFSILSTGQTAALAHTLSGSNDVFPHKDVPFGG